MMSKSITTLLLFLGTSSLSLAQTDTLSNRIDSILNRIEALEKNEQGNSPKVKLSGYIQAQLQYGEQFARFRVGNRDSKADKMDSRIGIRRGHLKLDYSSNIGQAVLQIDLTERGITPKDAYFELRQDKSHFGLLGLRLGIFDRPFGYEISYSSSRRESPERAYIFPELFPNERDLGGMLIWQSKQTAILDYVKLEAGLFSGNGIHLETDNRLDFIGHLSTKKELNRILTMSGGVSYYHGYVQHTQNNYWQVKDKKFYSYSIPKGVRSYALRQYWGADAQLSLNTPWGKTELRGEYLWGRQPSPDNGFKSPNTSKLHDTPLYVRQFSGGYVMLTHKLNTYPLVGVVKYDWLDPNVELSSEEIAKAGGSKSDVGRNTLGLGAIWLLNKQVSLQVYYDWVHNEYAKAIEGYDAERRDNLLTIRLQYRF